MSEKKEPEEKTLLSVVSSLGNGRSMIVSHVYRSHVHFRSLATFVSGTRPRPVRVRAWKRRSRPARTPLEEKTIIQWRRLASCQPTIVTAEADEMRAPRALRTARTLTLTLGRSRAGRAAAAPSTSDGSSESAELALPINRSKISRRLPDLVNHAYLLS